MTGYHISKSGKPAKCRASKRPCTAKPPAGMNQHHADSSQALKETIEKEELLMQRRKDADQKRAARLRATIQDVQCHGMRRGGISSCHS